MSTRTTRSGTRGQPNNNNSLSVGSTNTPITPLTTTDDEAQSGNSDDDLAPENGGRSTRSGANSTSTPTGFAPLGSGINPNSFAYFKQNWIQRNKHTPVRFWAKVNTTSTHQAFHANRWVPYSEQEQELLRQKKWEETLDAEQKVKMSAQFQSSQTMEDESQEEEGQSQETSSQQEQLPTSDEGQSIVATTTTTTTEPQKQEEEQVQALEEAEPQKQEEEISLLSSEMDVGGEMAAQMMMDTEVDLLCDPSTETSSLMID